MADGKVTIDTQIDTSGIKDDLKDVKKQAGKAGDSVKDYGEEFDKVSKKSGQSSQDVKDDLKDVKDSLSGIKDAIMASFAFDAISGFVTGLLDSTDELRGDLSLLQQNAVNAGIGLDVTSEAFKRLNTLSTEADSSVEAVSNLLAAGVPENRMLDAVEGISNAVVMFPDTLKIESLADSLQETLATGQATGQFAELLDRLGIGAQTFNDNMATITTETGRLDYALGLLNTGSLQGLYDGWVEANPELVEGRDTALEMQEAMADLAEQLQPIVTDIMEVGTGIAGWVANNVDLEHLFEVIIAGTLAISALKTVSLIDDLARKFGDMGIGLNLATAKIGVVAAGIFLISIAAMELFKAWDDMTVPEKVLGGLGLLAAALATVAIAIGAVQSAATLGIAAAAIAAGIAAVAIAVNSATRRAKAEAQKSAQFNFSQQQSFSAAGIPQLATGAVIPPNRRFTAVLGDQRNGMNLEAPEGLIRKIVREESGGGGSTVIRFSGSLAQLARVLKPEIEREGIRAGTPLAGGGRR